ncbi:hypothetical protein V4251_001840 [Serratia marcescens]
MSTLIGVIRILILVVATLQIKVVTVTATGFGSYFLAGLLFSLYCWATLKLLDYLKDYSHGQ